ncbi:leucyl aminopeptidase [Rhabdothermincola salaria]|uniref:leucyl aminopeptidase n=1 Tax=Rhabdothermincola salaria TaxID=2903142 RepID=UPI001E3EC834|nr:leucyl aminopeptidase [Rhabdothermincola salaria]MCD9623396.1 leucyl aminopeptidase [Rhabdothermincola salaria]
MPPVIEVSRDVPEGLDLLAVAVTTEGAEEPRLGEDELPATLLAAQGFTGAADQVALVPGSESGPPRVVVGVGPAAEVDADRLRRAAAQAVRAGRRVGSLGLRLLEVLDADVTAGQRAQAARAVAEGAGLGAYRFVDFRSEPTPEVLERVVVIGKGGAKTAAAVELGARIAEAQCLARDLVNTPGGTLTPAMLAEVAVEIAEREDLKVTVLGPDEIAEAGLGGLLGVNRGSNQEPRFVELAYEPERPRGTLAIVGKGITFDSGGLSIKSGEGMMTMKMDMGGAAAVIGAFSALRAVAPRCRVLGYLPMTDNMTGGDATRPGDVLTIRNGTTVEVLNTDAEGRLILADALCLASESEPDAIVDLATLTGAVEVALGNRIAGVLGNDEVWLDQVEAAAGGAGERIWPLPLPADYRSRLESTVADLRNISTTKDGGTITASLFLAEFVADGIPWAHIDIAGTAWWGDGDDGEWSKGGTGYGVRTLLELARTFTPPRRRRSRG